MSEFVYSENTIPDRPGIWWRKGACHPVAVTDDGLVSWSRGDWAFICDLPEIKDPPKWREVTAADVGREIEVSHNASEWNKRTLDSIKQSFVCKHSLYPFKDVEWHYARILDDGEPAKKPREFYINSYGTKSKCGEIVYIHNSRDSAEKANTEGRVECIHVREVIE